jgi:hypothetical protein
MRGGNAASESLKWMCKQYKHKAHSSAAPAGLQLLYITFLQRCMPLISYRFQDFISWLVSCKFCAGAVMWHFHVTLESIFARVCHWMGSRNVGGNSVSNFKVLTLNWKLP